MVLHHAFFVVPSSSRRNTSFDDIARIVREGGDMVGV